MAISFSCEYCGSKIKAQDGAAGRRLSCPSCKQLVSVPGMRVDVSASVPAVVQQSGAIVVGRAEVPCPFCGEFILEIAKKCRFCGEILDPELRRQIQQPPLQQQPVIQVITNANAQADAKAESKAKAKANESALGGLLLLLNLRCSVLLLRRLFFKEGPASRKPAGQAARNQSKPITQSHPDPYLDDPCSDWVKAMNRKKPYQFQDEEELIECLSGQKALIDKFFDIRWSLETVVRKAISGRTWRGPKCFHHLRRERPSVVFRDWAMARLQSKRTQTELNHIGSQAQYSRWIRTLTEEMCRAWTKRVERVLEPYGVARKLTDLLLKFLPRWEELTNKQRRALIKYAHVALDKYTLIGIRRCIEGLNIPPNPSLGSVKDGDVYAQAQEGIRNIVAKARCPAIYYDVLVWNILPALPGPPRFWN